MSVPLSLAQYYHEQTKYAPETLASQGRALDWENQPSPYKDYPIGTSLDLKPHLQLRLQDSDRLLPGDRLQRLSRLLFCSYGITQKVNTAQGPFYLRAAPSAGGLYPAELYVLSAGLPELPAGLYNYQVATHSLIRFWDSDIWPKLKEACLWHPSLENTRLALVVTGLFYRSAWRYQARAYRRICLDSGHLLGNIELACALNDFRPHLIGGFVDVALNQLLYLDPEQEGAIALLSLADLLTVEQNLPRSKTALPSPSQMDYPPIPEDDLLLGLHQASQISHEFGSSLSWKAPVWQPPMAIAAPGPAPTPAVVEELAEDKYNFPFCSRIAVPSEAIDWGEGLQGLERTLLRRRSTRAYTGQNLSLSELRALLDFTYQPQNYRYQGLDEAPDYLALPLLETFVTVSGVDGLDEGCYYYAPKAQELRQIRFKNFRQELHYLCLGQELGRDAAAVIFHTADLAKAAAAYGDRAYRYLHLDAGHLGQRLNLAAIYLGLGVSGIGGFFDDQVNEVLGIPEDEAVIYVTTLGRPR